MLALGPSEHSFGVPIIDRILGRPPAKTHAQVSMPPSPDVVIYWRDGCPSCARLRFAVRRYRDRAAWVNIWEDSQAASFVRSTNEDGYEVVPTVVIHGVAHNNPPPEMVRQALSR